MCRPAERTQPPFNQVSLIILPLGSSLQRKQPLLPSSGERAAGTGLHGVGGISSEDGWL